MTKFKIEDKVRRVRGNWRNVKEGGIYTVMTIFNPDIRLLGHAGIYDATRFELVEEEEEENYGFSKDE